MDANDLKTLKKQAQEQGVTHVVVDVRVLRALLDHVAARMGAALTDARADAAGSTSSGALHPPQKGGV